YRVRSVMLTVLMHIFLVSHVAQCIAPVQGASLHSGAMDLPWQDELCCDSPSAQLSVEDSNTHTPETNSSESNHPHYPRCSFRSSTTESQPHELSNGTCLDILCRIDENWENLMCDLQCHSPPSSTLDAGLVEVSLQRLVSQKEDTMVNDGNTAPYNPVVCEAEDSFMCSLALDTTTSFVTVVTVSIGNAVAPASAAQNSCPTWMTVNPNLLNAPEMVIQSKYLLLLYKNVKIPSYMLQIPLIDIKSAQASYILKPSPPVNLSHIQTIEAELILHWDNPSDFDTGPLRYEIRYSSNTTHPAWQVVSAPGEPRSSLDLKPRLNYTIQVRCSSLNNPPLWSEWSEPHHIYLDKGCSYTLCATQEET
ncbi:Leptin receptor, partial [Larimichthys crocea]